jgi:RNA polymerase sigma-70 factor (ECF subfamily)
MALQTNPPVGVDTSTPAPSDKTLLRRYRAGQEEAATCIYHRYAPRLRALAREFCPANYAGRFDADDVVQSVFRTFFQGSRKGAYEVPCGGELWGLLMVLTLNKIRSLVEFHRAGKRAVHQTASVGDLSDHPSVATDDSAAALLRMVLDEQMAGLPDSNRDIIRLRIEGYEVGEIAKETGRSRRTVERVLQQFRSQLAKC